MIKARVIPRFVEFLRRQDHPQLQAVWAWDVAGDSPTANCQESCSQLGALLPLLSQLNENSKLSMLRMLHGPCPTFVVGNHQPFEEVKPALPVLRQLIYLNDEEVLTDACWALSYLSDGPNDKIQAVIEAGVCPRLVELLSNGVVIFKLSSITTVLIPALRTVGNIVTAR
ncbi:Importin subunit alpha-4 [Raphanus sativus]|nr:Importin subunit alpha-4 [Raphanus sativus]